MKNKKKEKQCLCRAPKRHTNCAYCGCGGDGIHICGVCKEHGIDGPIIRGTGRVVCSLHKKKGGEMKKYPELDNISEFVEDITCLLINRCTLGVKSAMPYKEQYVLEKVIERLQRRV